jgi:hypothetical protein
MSEEKLGEISPELFEEIKLPNAQLRGVGVHQQPEKRTLKKSIIFRITPRQNIHHDLVLNAGDCANVLGLTLQLPLKTAWWLDSEARSARVKVVPSVLANISAALAERSL